MLGNPIPVLRMFDERKAREFYLDYLGFTLDWEHRYGAGFPLYMQVSRDGCILRLTEHYGDCCPGAAMRVPVDEIAAFHASLSAKDYTYAKPVIEETPWETRDVAVTDPFGNRLTFYGQSGKS